MKRLDKLAPPNKKYEQLTHPKYRADIDGLRAIAVLSVVCFHAFPSWLQGGFIGVDIFFVISGFLISTIIFDNLEKESFSFIEFYSRRINRIFPALLLVLATCIAFGWFELLSNEYKQLGKHIVAGAGFVSNFLLQNESGYFDNIPRTKPLLHLWTLGIEEQFYIMWPLLLWIAWKKKFNLLKLTLAIAVISFALNIRGSQSDAIATFYSPQTRFWELLIGSILAYVKLYEPKLLATKKREFNRYMNTFYTQSNDNTLNNIQALLGAVLIGAGLLLITKEREFPGTWALLPTLGTTLIISADSNAWLNRVILSNRILVWFGLISFPLYLWHWPLLSFASIVGYKLPANNVCIVTIFGSILLAWLTYKFIENPIRLGESSKVKTITLAILMVIIGNVGYLIYKHDGFEFRIPKILNQLTSYKYNFASEYRLHTCFLDQSEDFNIFKNCVTNIDNNKKTLILWGDSHAAHLYRGFEASFGNEFNIIQRTVSACAPILDMDSNQQNQLYNYKCPKINNEIIQYIETNKPDKVVIAANWDVYSDENWSKLENTIIKLKKIGIINIDLIGPVPKWQGRLPQQLYKFYKKHPFQDLPKKMQFGLNKNISFLDPIFKELAVRQGINYISPVKFLCSEDGCLTRLGDTGDSLITWDYGHLTTAGSIYLVEHFK